MKRITILLLFTVFLGSAFAQSGDFVKVLPAQKALDDSLKKMHTPNYIFPLWGKRLAKKGFMLPYPGGVMLNTYMGKQNITIPDITVGINDADGNVLVPETSLNGIVEFSKVQASVKNVNVRADLWILPFLDVYGIMGAAWVTTDVGIGSIAGHAVDISTQADFSGYVYGVGGMLTGGVRSIFFSLDYNVVWTHFSELKNDNMAMNLAPRVGYVFHFNNNPEKNISIWTGAARIFLNNTTEGSLTLSDIAPDLGQNYQSQPWYQDLETSRPQIAKLVDKVFGNFVDKNKGDVINYSLEKRPSHNWCMILGVQFQLNRHWQFRTEGNFLGGRASGLISANYRFGI